MNYSCFLAIQKSYLALLAIRSACDGRNRVGLSNSGGDYVEEVIKVMHTGYRCPNLKCRASGRIYCCIAADALALLNFTFALNVVVLLGQLHLGKQQAVDEAEWRISEWLAQMASKYLTQRGALLV